MKKEIMKLFFITGVNPSNKHEYHYVLAKDKQSAIETHAELHPDVAITKIKILRPNPKNLKEIEERIKVNEAI